MMSASDRIISVIHLTASVFNSIMSVPDSIVAGTCLIMSVSNIMILLSNIIIADADRKAGLDM